MITEYICRSGVDIIPSARLMHGLMQDGVM